MTKANTHCHSQPQSGISRWGNRGEGTLFRDRFEIDASEGDDEAGFGGGMAFVVTVATVDQSWGERVGKVWPDVGPQVRCGREVWGVGVRGGWGGEAVVFYHEILMGWI